MAHATGPFLHHLGSTLRTALLGPQLAAFLPALLLGGYWFGGEGVLLFSAIIFPALFAIAGIFVGQRSGLSGPREGLTDLPLRQAGVAHLDRLIAQANGRMVACFALEIDDYDNLVQKENPRLAEAVLRSVADRLQSTMRKSDQVFKMDGPRFGIIVTDLPSGDLETLIQIATRFQRTIEDPISIEGYKTYQTVSVGFAKAGYSDRASGSTMVSAAELALDDAVTHGGSSIRAFAPEMKERADKRSELANEVAEALDNGDIRPWFQPQIATESGTVSGIEALARWEHPTRGIVSPMDFVQMVQSMGLAQRLSEVILSASLRTLRDWDKLGVAVPTVAVNFSTEDLRNPKLPERIRWELDRYDLAPERLVIEVMETVIAEGQNDVILRNLKELASMGSRIDLDDFGTGHASITNIRRFGVGRIKIDRSFVTKLDTDRDQRSLVAAILTMAERLSLDTLAEGVETTGEYAILSQMGCAHIQGFCIARPMPAEEFLGWHAKYREKQAKADADSGADPLSNLLQPPEASGKTA